MAMVRRALWVIWLLLVDGLFSVRYTQAFFTSNGVINEWELYRDLLEDYIRARPRRDPWDNLTVHIDLTLSSVVRLDGTVGTLTFLGSVEMTWCDDYLNWDLMNYRTVDVIVMPASDVWLPDVAVINRHAALLDPDWEKVYPVRVTYEGLVTWKYTDLFTTECAVNMEMFPFDTQYCKIEFGLLMSPAHLTQLSFNYTHYQKGEDLKLSDEFDIRYDVPSVNPNEVVITLRLRRSPVYYVLNIIIPCCLLTLITVLSFCLPPSSGERVSLQVTVLLSLTVFQLLLAGIVPVTSKNIPVLSIVIALMMGLSVLSVLATVYCLRLYEPHGRPMGPATRYYILYVMRTILCCKHCALKCPSDVCQKYKDTLCPARVANNGPVEHEASAASAAGIEVEENEDAQSIKDPGPEEWDAEWKEAARVMDRFFAIFFFCCIVGINAIMFGIYPHSQSNVHP